jgi:N-acylneuraminate cytidylyltransferase
MIINSVSIFLPVRGGSLRVKNKNTRPFANFKGGLLELKLLQLSKLRGVYEVILSSNDEICLDLGRKMELNFPKLKVVERPNNLATDSVDLVELAKYVPTVCAGDHILWTHVTSPFVNNMDYEQAISEYFKALGDGFDSLMSVQRFQNFLWNSIDNDIINRVSSLKWPRTQDLADLYEINSAIFLASKSIYLNEFDRIGKKPYLLKQDKIKSFDIDWEDDFKIAELIYNGNLLDI